MEKERTYAIELTKTEWDIIDHLMYQALHGNNSEGIKFQAGYWGVLSLAHTKLKERVLDIHEYGN